MNQSNSIFRNFSSPLAVWRVTPADDEPGRWSLIGLPWTSCVPGIPRYLRGCFYFWIHWISLPLAIWLSTGWVGLLVHSQALTGLVFLVERANRRLQVPMEKPIACGETLEGDASCAGTKYEVY